MHLLPISLFGHSLSIDEFQESPDIHGAGLSDLAVHAKWLENKHGYTNTYYHKEPRLDITAVPEQLCESCDFIVPADVFDHVLWPVSGAFHGAWNPLKPDGRDDIPRAVHQSRDRNGGTFRCDFETLNG